METIICMIANLFRMYIVYRFVGIFFAEKKSPKLLFLVYGVYYVINTAFYLGLHLAWVNIINAFVGVAFIVSLYTRSVRKIIGVASSIYILNMICDIIATVPFREYVDAAGTSNQILFVFCDFLYLICELVAERILKTRDEGQHIPLVLVPLISVVLLMYMIYSGQVMGVPIVVVSIGLLLINFLVIYLYNELLSSLKKIHENTLLNEKIEMYHHQIQIISQNEKRVSALRHDLKNHFSEIQIMAGKGKYSEIQSYIGNMLLYIGDSEEIVKTGNVEMDSLLNYLLQKAREQLHEVDVKVNVPEDIMNLFDINVVVGNLLDNAIEAAGATDEKVLKGFITLEQGIFKLQFTNSYKKERQQQGDKQPIGKKKRHHSSIGLKNVQEIVDKYNGIMEITEGKYFDIRVLLYVSKD